MVHIHAERVGIDFPIYGNTGRSLKNSILHATTGGRLATTASRTVVAALSNISLDLREGDRLGLVGGNGAGKTTLLRVLASIYEPTRGTLTTSGQIVPLFGGSLGMDLELPGFDNIILRGMILGLSRRQIMNKIDDIAAFTELEDFLHLPVRTYSAGMRVRLAFAISTSVDADILLLDEGVGAGDASFMNKAQARLLDFVERTGLLVLATHSTTLMRKICSHAIWMHRGEIKRHGPVDDVMTEYREWILEQQRLRAEKAA